MLQSPVVSVQVSSANVCWTPYCNDDYGHIYNIDFAKDFLHCFGVRQDNWMKWFAMAKTPVKSYPMPVLKVETKFQCLI